MRLRCVDAHVHNTNVRQFSHHASPENVVDTVRGRDPSLCPNSRSMVRSRFLVRKTGLKAERSEACRVQTSTKLPAATPLNSPSI